MPSTTTKKQCFMCRKEKITYKCEGCSKDFCIDDLSQHRQVLNKQFDEIEHDRNLLFQSLIQQSESTKKHPLTQQIDEWENDSINKIKQTAEECRQSIITYINTFINEIKNKLKTLTKQIKQMRQDNEFNEIDINFLKEKLKNLNDEFNKPTNIKIEQQATSFINKISVITPFVPLHVCWTDIPPNAKWNKNAQTVAGQNPTLYNPFGLYVDDEQTIYVADCWNHRIVAWKSGETNGQIVAGGHGQGNDAHQLNTPSDVIVDKERDSLIICNCDNRRVVRWPRQNGTSGEIIISNISCWGLTMDDKGFLYITDIGKHEVRRYRMGESQGIVVAGGNGKGNRLDQLSFPTYIFVDREHSVYVSDRDNHRVMKWIEGAKEGIVVAGGQGQGDSLTQLSYPNGVLVDQLGAIYVADCYNHRIVRWPKGAQQGNVIVGGNGKGAQANQLNWPMGLSFDRQGNLYAVDVINKRIQRFNIEIS